MFGYLRFTLAFFVMLSHVGVKIYGMNPGVTAVVIFYILAGFVVSHLYRDIFSDKKKELLYFYKDRILRIFPLYLYVVAITLIFLLATSFGNPLFEPLRMVENLLIIPLNYYMYIDSTILQDPKWCLVPPAWSLGTELQAYILLPLALVFRQVKFALFIITYSVYTLANFSFLQPDYFGYRLIAGVFFIFLLGVSIHKNEKEDRYILISTVIVTILFVIISIWVGSFGQAFSRETFIGITVGVPLVFAISKIKNNFPLNALLGSLSYALFLTHFLSIWILKYLKIMPSQTFVYILEVLSISLFFSFIGVFFIEEYFRKKRIKK
ncbi:acyltransferase family protein [Sulfurovum sp. NBC37-1]|uniref:acyltransferase family protein n=1 Tax=Sulfurovum sp. (strain NBC37-1) TaxID=387093 RepID=UPI0001587705|nr:acyltransferase [Sulfurovum sp. NBC37-1]BAF71289.1 conserved hypothetical protein [Sulfurovum sp. NBC37-1]